VADGAGLNPVRGRGRLSLALLLALPWLLSGALALAMGLILPMPSGFQSGGYVALGLAAAGVGAWMLGRGYRIGARGHAAVCGLGVVLTSLSLYWGGADLFAYSPNEVIYLWLLIYAAYFFPIRAVVALLCLVAAGYGAAIIALDPAGYPWLRWLLVMFGLSGTALIVWQLRARLDYGLSLSRATLESTTDGILVVDLDGRWRGVNRNFLQMWRIPDEFADGRNDDAALEFVLGQVEDPARFLAKVRELYNRADEESFDEIRFKDGRVLERYSKPQRVDGRVVGRVWSFRDVTDKRLADEQLQHLADHDPLTDLRNRRSFEEELERELLRNSRYGSGGALLLLDLDDFKGVNDTHGHLWGDEVLRGVARLLSSRLRSTDVLGRIGGDEFAVLLPEADRVRAVKLAEELLEVIREQQFETDRGTLGITTSIGVVSLEDLEGSEAMVAADKAMYAAKREGRDRLTVYAPAVA
jgi:diguanylate cyclase (GGDEF)-like protein/PAS domain S-box-containing protein